MESVGDEDERLGETANYEEDVDFSGDAGYYAASYRAVRTNDLCNANGACDEYDDLEPSAIREVKTLSKGTE